eukprot:11022475-Alexandrium_andersonii.AAC.1
MVERGWAEVFDSPDELSGALGAAKFPIDRLALISKMKPDGTWKHRIIWDLRRSRVNALVRQGERIAPPRLLDVVQDALELLEAFGDDVTFLGTDVSDAFHQVPISSDEYPFTVAALG